MRRHLGLYTILCLLSIPGTSPAETSFTDTVDLPAPADLIARIEESRKTRDNFLLHAQDSPLPASLRPGFKGLDYFPVDLEFRVAGDLHIYGRRQRIRVPTNTGSVVAMEKFGRFVGLLKGKSFRLEIYRSLEQDELLVLFKDTTSGRQTYSGGRYVRLAALGNGTYILDFNMAYNPYCAYDPAYVCPMAPPRNNLSLSIRAGEKAFGTNLAH